MNTPVFDALKNYNNQKLDRFHMPGHKGKGILFDGLGQDIIALDVTELAETDNLAAPESIFCNAQNLAAIACGTGETLFLTGGSTLGNLAMLYGTCYGEKVIVDRLCHLSVFNALTLCCAKPVYTDTALADSCGIIGAVSVNAIKKAIKENPDAKAVFITSPNSFGICSNLKEIAKLCHEADQLLLVDEAHGAHFAFSDKLPQTAAKGDADASVQSFHKTLPALTQAAVLHINNKKISKKIASALRLFQTSSPSYLLTASLDYARAFMEENKSRLDILIDTVNEHSSSNVLKIIGADPLKIIIKCDGIKGEKILRENGFVPEMYGRGYIVLIVSIADDKDTVCKLLSIAEKLPESTSEIFFQYSEKNGLSPAEAYHLEGEFVPISLAEGRVSKNAVFLYPPGVPVIAPGHIIEKDVIDFINNENAEGTAFCGLVNGKINVIK